MIKYISSHSLLSHNTFGIDVTATHFIEFTSVNDISDIVDKLCNVRHLVIGGGSNLLFMNDYDGVILHSAIKEIEVVEENDYEVIIRVGSGVLWDDFVAYTVENGWQGLENLSAIPGEVGASAVQNIGAYGVEAGDFIEKVETVSLVDGGLHVFTKENCAFGYRKSIFKNVEKNKHVVTYVVFRLNKIPRYVLTYGNLKNLCEKTGKITVENIRKVVIETRSAKLPAPEVMGSAGSFFMNPIIENDKADRLKKIYPDMPVFPSSGRTKVSAAWLIDQCGWKNKSDEHVGVYRNQALVIVNLGGATGRDIMNFAVKIQDSVMDKFGISISPEVNIID